MSSEGYNFPINELRESLKRYRDARIRVDLYHKTLCDEAQNLFSRFVKYARKEQDKGSCNFSKVMGSFYLEVLNMNCDSKDKTVRASLTKRFKKLMKRQIREDPRYQIKLDEFMT